MKQPHEKKADYRKADEIVNEVKFYIEGKPREVKKEDGTVVIKKSPFVDLNEGNNLYEKMVEHNGVLKDTFENTKTKKSKAKNKSYQGKLDNAKNRLKDIIHPEWK